MSKKHNPSDADEIPPPAYQESADPPFNPNFREPRQSPPHTPAIQQGEASQSLYPQLPSPTVFPQPQHYQQQQQSQYHLHQQPQYHTQQSQQQPNQVRYQAIEIPYNITTEILRDRRRRHAIERRKFPLAAIFFLFGW